jgi:hypothetical protein
MPISLFPKSRPAPAPSDDALATVRALNQQYLAASAANDTPWFERHLAADAVLVLGDGRRLGRPEFLTLLLERPRRYRSVEATAVRQRAYGPTVQVDADASWELEDGSRRTLGYIAAWTWFEGRWQVILAQVTPLPP